MAKKKPAKYHEQKVLADKYGRDLQGLGDHALARQRGLRGTKLGPANAGRRLSQGEVSAIEQKLRAEGKIK